jgi:hypothetical protein
MSLIEEKLLLIESRLQVFVEGAADHLFPGGRVSNLLARRLMSAVREGLRVTPEGGLVAPQRLALLVCPAELDLFRSPRWLEEIEAALRAIGGGQGVRFPPGRFLQVEARDRLAPGEVLVVSCDERGAVSQTTDIAMQDDGLLSVPPGAFLIVDGMHFFPLNLPVLNLGRRPDNHLVIDDNRVSRTHAQLRLVRGQFVVFDLESSGGTFVNGVRILQQVLHPGDVLSLAGVPLVFGQDNPGLSETQEFIPTE